MKLEPFPWLQDYLIDMDELYTELTLQKLNNTRCGVTGKTLGNYEDMFKEYSDLQRHTVKKEKREKNLSKGDAGMGKSTLGKKIGLDWARGLFQNVFNSFLYCSKNCETG